MTRCTVRLKINHKHINWKLTSSFLFILYKRKLHCILLPASRGKTNRRRRTRMPGSSAKTAQDGKKAIRPGQGLRVYFR